MTEAEQRSLIIRESYDLSVPERALIERGLLLAESLGKKEYSCPILGAKFVLIPAGTFMMGSPDEIPHQVTISEPFYLQTTPVTQVQWKKVMGNNPSHFKGDDTLPVEMVSWNDVQKFIRKLNKMRGADKYRLPTEAQWEYACRAGSTTAYCFGDDEKLLWEYACYDAPSTYPVRQKKPNAWGLYDMHYNVWEWCQDWYDTYPSDSITDPVGPSKGTHRVFRGGGWGFAAWVCRSSMRNYGDPGARGDCIGFRLLRTL